MKELESTMRNIEIDGLTWGTSKLVPLAFGIKKLQVNLVVEDEKVSIDDLQARIEADEGHVQSTDVVCYLAFLIFCDTDELSGRYAKALDVFHLLLAGRRAVIDCLVCTYETSKSQRFSRALWTHVMRRR